MQKNIIEDFADWLFNPERGNYDGSPVGPAVDADLVNDRDAEHRELMRSIKETLGIALSAEDFSPEELKKITDELIEQYANRKD